MRSALSVLLALFISLMCSSWVAALTPQGTDVQLQLRVTELEGRVDRVITQVNQLNTRVTELQKEINLLKTQLKPGR